MIMDKKILSNPWVIAIGTGILLYFLLPTDAGIHNKDDINGSIQTVNQTGGTNIISDNPDLKQKIEYLYVATLNGLGRPYEVNPPLTLETGISAILKPYIFPTATGIGTDCAASARRAFEQAIELEPKFPFPYYYLASCEKLLGKLDWKTTMTKALDIFLITTQIPNHNPNHDEALNDIRARFGL